MIIKLTEDMKEEVRKNVKAKDVFTENAMNYMLDGIREGENQRLTDDWDFGAGDYKHLTNIQVGNMYLDRDVLEYTLYAYELSIHDFMEEFGDYVLSTEQIDCLEMFEGSLEEGNIDIMLATEELDEEVMGTLWDDTMDTVENKVDTDFDLSTFIEESGSYSYFGIAKSEYHDAIIRLYPDMKMEISEKLIELVPHKSRERLLDFLKDMGFSE